MLSPFRKIRPFYLLTAAVATAYATDPRNQRHGQPATAVDRSVAGASAATALVNARVPAAGSAANLPPLPAGVEELKLSELFQQPVGPRGLELSDKVRRLNGQRVRILGYMVEQGQPAPRCLLLSPRPVELHEEEWGFSEDLPATTIHVFVSSDSPEFVPFTPGPLLLTGTLSVGNRVEPDQRISTVRLQLDPPTATAASTKSAPVAANARSDPSLR